MPDFPDTSGHLHSDNHVKTGIFPHNYPSRLRKYNILLHITYVRRSLNRSCVVLIFTAVKKLKPCGSYSSPIIYTNFRSY